MHESVTSIKAFHDPNNNKEKKLFSSKFFHVQESTLIIEQTASIDFMLNSAGVLFCACLLFLYLRNGNTFSGGEGGSNFCKPDWGYSCRSVFYLNRRQSSTFSSPRGSNDLSTKHTSRSLVSTHPFTIAFPSQKERRTQNNLLEFNSRLIKNFVAVSRELIISQICNIVWLPSTSESNQAHCDARCSRRQYENQSRQNEEKFGFIPCFQIREFLGDDLPQVDAQPIDDPLREVGMWRSGKHFNVRHCWALFVLWGDFILNNYSFNNSLNTGVRVTFPHPSTRGFDTSLSDFSTSVQLRTEKLSRNKYLN